MNAAGQKAFVELFGPHASHVVMGEYTVHPHGIVEFQGHSEPYVALNLDSVARTVTVVGPGEKPICTGVEGAVDVHLKEAVKLTQTEAQALSTEGVEVTTTSDPDFIAAKGPTPEQLAGYEEAIEEGAGLVMVEAAFVEEAAGHIVSAHPFADLDKTVERLKARLAELQAAQAEDAKFLKLGTAGASLSEGGANTTGEPAGDVKQPQAAPADGEKTAGSAS